MRAFCRCLLLVLVGSLSVYGLINPNFTPLHLVDQSGVIVLLKTEKPVKDGQVTAVITRILKGKAEKQTIVIDLKSTAFKEKSEKIKKLINQWKGTEFMFFEGSYYEEGDNFGGGEFGFEEDMEDDAGAEEEDPEDKKGYLHINGIWVLLFEGRNGVWTMDNIDTNMQATWAGSTDMLVRCVDYILKDPDATVPPKTYAKWGGKAKLGTLEGKAYETYPVDVFGDNRRILYVSGEKGDRLFQYSKKDDTLKDITERTKLGSMSKVSLWADITDDGRLDLLSWNGSGLSLYVQAADRTFSQGTIKAPDLSKSGCLGMAYIDRGPKKGLGVVVSTETWPLLWVPEKGEGTVPLGTGTFPAKKMGKTSTCLVADLDSDNLPDVLQLYAKGAIVCKGKDLGVFEPAAVIQMEAGAGASDAYLGDYDADGVLDVMTVAADFPRLWHNLGKMKFVNMLGFSGEIAYISKPGSMDGMTGDVNNDGRQDMLLVYSEMAPQIFFNRGFRSTGHSHMLDISERGLLPEADQGQYAGCLGDLNKDGAQDMVIVLKKNNDVWAFFRDTPFLALSVRVKISPQADYKGPLTVTGYTGTRCLGAWNVTAGREHAFFGQFEAGPCVITWQMPGGKKEKKEIILEDKPVVFEIK